MLKALIDYSNPDSFASTLRRKRFHNIESLVKRVLTEKMECTILDVGGTAVYWNLMNRDLRKRCSITILNLEHGGGHDPGANMPSEGKFEFIQGDGRDLRGILDNQYDISHSNSVIEHVGFVSDMKKFASELARVGRFYYVQTPNFWFPIEPHYGFPLIHWLPSVTRAWLISRFNLGFLTKMHSIIDAHEFVDSTHLIDQRTLKALFEDGEIRKEKFLFITKSLICVGD